MIWVQLIRDGLQLRDSLPTWIWLLVLISILSVLVYLVRIDIKTKIIPNRILLPAYLVSLPIIPLLFENWLTHFLASLLSAILFGVLACIKIRNGYGFGMGDAKLYTWLSLFTAQGIAVVMLVASLSGLIRIGIKKAQGGSLRERIAHAPDIALGFVVVILIGLIYPLIS
jgi:leader peptidase (prepilin peptidase)/N-methyltransferase